MALVQPMQAILRCLTDDGFVSRGRGGRTFYTAELQRQVVTLRRGGGLPAVRARFRIEYAVLAASDRQGWWEAQITGWVHDVLDASGRTIVAFHWHPVGSGRVTWPHLHAYGVNESVELHKLHPPTGTITASSVVRFLIEDLDVLPRRPDWQAILERHADV